MDTRDTGCPECDGPTFGTWRLDVEIQRVHKTLSGGVAPLQHEVIPIMVLATIVSRIVASRVRTRDVGNTAVRPACLQPLLQPVVRILGGASAAGDVELNHTAGIGEPINPAAAKPSTTAPPPLSDSVAVSPSL